MGYLVTILWGIREILNICGALDAKVGNLGMMCVVFCIPYLVLQISMTVI